MTKVICFIIIAACTINARADWSLFDIFDLRTSTPEESQARLDSLGGTTGSLLYDLYRGKERKALFYDVPKFVNGIWTEGRYLWNGENYGVSYPQVPINASSYPPYIYTPATTGLTTATAPQPTRSSVTSAPSASQSTIFAPLPTIPNRPASLRFPASRNCLRHFRLRNRLRSGSSNCHPSRSCLRRPIHNLHTCRYRRKPMERRSSTAT
jgi:hypothetical protein